MNFKRTILVVTSEPKLARLLEAALSSKDHEVKVEDSGLNAVTVAGVCPLDGVVLQLGFTDIHAIEVARHLRSWFSGPILGLAGEVDPRVWEQAFEEGIDDIVRSPFSREEIRLRFRSFTRRARAVAQRNRGTVTVGELELDRVTGDSYFLGEELGLTPREQDVLAALIGAGGKAIEVSEIAITLWGEAANRHADSIRVHISNIRRKLREAGVPGEILTLRGGRYAWNADPAADPPLLTHERQVSPAVRPGPNRGERVAIGAAGSSS